jgi:2-(1,2-epoxy-1,2-dihydrophenyl)acetyl-CoA isomerase
VTAFANVLVDVHEGIGTVTLSRPEKLNAFGERMRREVAQAMDEMATDPAVRVIVVTGAGRAFCAGADVDYMRALTARGDIEGFCGLVEAGRRVVSTIRATPKPVIASVNGAAAGGGANLALACDIRIASDRASIGQTFGRIGLHPDWGGIHFLPRLVGTSKALELIWSGAMLPASEALAMGLFSRVVPHERLAAETDALARELAARAPLALALAKQAVYGSASSTLAETLEMELDCQLRCFQSADAKEGLQAFLEKRDPTFRGA